MIREQRLAVSLFAIGFIGLGTLSVIYRDFAFDWQRVPPFHPGRDVLAVLCGLFMIAVSAALLFRATTTIAARSLLPFLLAWQCLKVPALIVAPQMEAVWLGFGEIAMLLAGGLVLFARFSRLENSGSFVGHITGERRQDCQNHIRCGSSSGWALPYLLCWDHGKHDSIVAALSRWTCLSHRCGTDGMRSGSAILYFPASGSPHRDRDADSLCIPCVGSEQMDLIQSALCRHTLGTEISADGILDYLGHWCVRSLGRDQRPAEAEAESTFC